MAPSNGQSQVTIDLHGDPMKQLAVALYGALGEIARDGSLHPSYQGLLSTNLFYYYYCLCMVLAIQELPVGWPGSPGIDYSVSMRSEDSKWYTFRLRMHEFDCSRTWQGARG
jgi:hypothetical protein